MTTIVAISDTHGMHDQVQVPDGDILIHAGDATKGGTYWECKDFLKWLSAQPHPIKIFVPGNHDFLFEKQPEAWTQIVPFDVFLLNHRPLWIHSMDGLKIFGSPYQPTFNNWAFNVDRGPDIARLWGEIPNDLDILITHGPAYTKLDANLNDERVGCEDLLRAIELKKPKLHICGHIHESYGITYNNDTVFINASTCDRSYRPVNKPIVYEL